MSKKKNKYNYWKNVCLGDGDDLNEQAIVLQANIRQNYINKYYNIWMNKFKWSGLDEEVKEQQENYIMRKFWSEGTCAAFKIKNTDLLGYTTWATNQVNMYNLPEVISLNNEHGVSEAIIPNTPQVVNKTAVIGWCQPNHKSIQAVVNYYIDRLIQVDMVINTNLQLQKMPFLVGVDAIDADKMRDIVRRILNNEIVVFADLQDLAKVQSFATQTPYIIDKLSAYKRDVEHELMTFFGIDNNDNQLEKSHIAADAINANNDIINNYRTSIKDEIDKFLAQIKRVFNRDITIEDKVKPVASIHEEINGGNDNDDTNN